MHRSILLASGGDGGTILDVVMVTGPDLIRMNRAIWMVGPEIVRVPSEVEDVVVVVMMMGPDLI